MELNRVQRDWPVAAKKEMDKVAVGQNNYKKALLMAVFRQLNTGQANHFMVMGPTGSGKTFIIECLKRITCLPKDYTVMISNVSGLTEAGVVGQSLEDIFSEYKQKCKAEQNLRYRGLIYIDEIDKLISPSYVVAGNGQSDKNVSVQHQLMKILDGGMIEGVPLNNVLFVFGGAFYQLANMSKEEVKHNPIGFCNTEPEQSLAISDSTIRDKLIEAGFQREFLGRISKIVELEPLTRNELTAILMHPVRGVIPILQRSMETDGIELIVKKSAVSGIIDAVVKEKLGARSARNILENILDGSWFECLENGYDRIVIDAETLKNGKIIYEKKSSSKELKKKIEKIS